MKFMNEDFGEEKATFLKAIECYEHHAFYFGSNILNKVEAPKCKKGQLSTP